MRKRKKIECHRSIVSLFLQFSVFMLPLFVIYLFFSRYWNYFSLQNYIDYNLVLRTYKAICFALILEMARRYFNELYVFGQKRIIHFKGRLSFRYHQISITYKDIRDIGVKQSLLGRLLNYGTVTFATSSGDGYEITMLDLAYPHEFVRYINNILEETRRPFKSRPIKTKSDHHTHQFATKAGLISS